MGSIGNPDTQLNDTNGPFPHINFTKFLYGPSAGECRLENMRTLCVACHAEVTAAQCSERRSERAKAKKQLKRMLANLKAVEEAAKIAKQKVGSFYLYYLLVSHLIMPRYSVNF